eukprot:13357910-Alexandrium_andersonii.AAC.1
MTKEETDLFELAKRHQELGHNVRIVKPDDPRWERPEQLADFGAPERWSVSNPCVSEPLGAGPGGEGARSPRTSRSLTRLTTG